MTRKHNNLLFGVISPEDEIKKRETAIVSDLEQRAVLLSEIDHRVKNNLMIVSSLLSLEESKRSIDLSAAKRRVDSIGHVHDLLSNSKSIGYVNLYSHIETIVHAIVGTDTTYTVDIEVDDINISTKDAVAIGLVVNELVTNARFHGLKNYDEGMITVAARRHERRDQRLKGTILELRISNDGAPLPPNFSIAGNDSFGLQLIQLLVGQLGGTIDFELEPVTTFRIELRLSET